MSSQSCLKPDELLPAGAYVICSKNVPAVVHIQHPNYSFERASVQAFQQNEGQFKDQQIWWIEPLAHCSNESLASSTELLYSITSPGTRKVLSADPASGWVYADFEHGDPWQRWRLRKVKDPNDREVSYNIVNAFNDKVIDIHGDKPQPGAWVKIQQHADERQENRWEFEIPVLAFPPGWFQIKNVDTGDLLSHDYDYNPPVLVAPPKAPVQSQYREQWGLQWALSHSKCHKPATGERNSWCIINRLTKKRLSPHFDNMKEEDFAGRDNNLEWKLTLDISSTWKIKNRATLCLLEQSDSIIGGRKAVGCSNQGSTQSSSRQSWILRYFSSMIATTTVPGVGEREDLCEE